MPSDRVWRTRVGVRFVVFACGAAVCAITALTASANTETKPYHATINGATSISVAAGSTFTANIAIVNDSGHPLGSANIVVPSPLGVGPVNPLVAVSGGKTWNDAVENPDNTIKLRNPGPAQTNALTTGQSATVTTPMRAPCTTSSPQTYTLDTQAKQSNDFNGVGNDLFLPDANEPRITVTGTCQLAVTILATGGGDPVAGDAFTIDIDLLDGAGSPMTLANALSVTVCEDGDGAFGGSVAPTAGCFATSIAAGTSEKLVTGVTYAPAENFVTVTASTATSGIASGSAVMSVVNAKKVVTPGQADGSTCTDTGPNEVCVRVLLPQAVPAGKSVTLTVRQCAGLVATCQSGRLGEVLGDLGSFTGAVVGVIEYDRLLRVSTKEPVMFDDLKAPPDGDPVDGPRQIFACAKGGVIPAGQPACVLKIGKDPAGDSVVEVKFRPGDPRISW